MKSSVVSLLGLACVLSLSAKAHDQCAMIMTSVQAKTSPYVHFHTNLLSPQVQSVETLLDVSFRRSPMLPSPPSAQFAPQGHWAVVRLQKNALVLIHPRLPAPMALREASEGNAWFTFSPRGQALLYAKDEKLHLMRLSPEGTAIPQLLSASIGVPQDAKLNPRFSTDGKRVPFWFQKELIVIDLQSGKIQWAPEVDVPVLGSSGDLVIFADAQGRNLKIWNVKTRVLKALNQDLPAPAVGRMMITQDGFIIPLANGRHAHIGSQNLQIRILPGTWSRMLENQSGDLILMQNSISKTWSVLNMTSGLFIEQLDPKIPMYYWGAQNQIVGSPGPESNAGADIRPQTELHFQRSNESPSWIMHQPLYRDQKFLLRSAPGLQSAPVVSSDQKYVLTAVSGQATEHVQLFKLKWQ